MSIQLASLKVVDPDKVNTIATKIHTALNNIFCDFYIERKKMQCDLYSQTIQEIKTSSSKHLAYFSKQKVLRTQTPTKN
jgi:hypothetical protein